MRKKLFTAVSVVMLTLICAANVSESTDCFEGHWGLDTERTLYFATEKICFFVKRS